MQVQYPFLYHIEGTLKNKRKSDTYLVLDYHTIDIKEVSSEVMDIEAPVVMELPNNNVVYRYYNNILMRSGNEINTKYHSNAMFGYTDKINDNEELKQNFMTSDDFLQLLEKMTTGENIRYSIIPSSKIDKREKNGQMQKIINFYRSMPVFKCDNSETVHKESDLSFKNIISSERDLRVKRIEEWATKMVCINGIMFFPSPEPYISNNSYIIGINAVSYERHNDSPPISVLCPNLIGFKSSYDNSLSYDKQNHYPDINELQFNPYNGPDYILRRPELLRKARYIYDLNTLYNAIGKIEDVSSLSINQLSVLIEIKKIYNDIYQKDDKGYIQKTRSLTDDEKEYIANLVNRLHDKSNERSAFIGKTNWNLFRNIEKLSRENITTKPYQMINGKIQEIDFQNNEQNKKLSM